MWILSWLLLLLLGTVLPSSPSGCEGSQSTVEGGTDRQRFVYQAFPLLLGPALAVRGERARELREKQRETERTPGHAHLGSCSSMKGGHHHQRHHRGCGCQHLFRKVLTKCGCCYARVRGQCLTTTGKLPSKFPPPEFTLRVADAAFCFSCLACVFL